jgi:DtxR family Mn-dependent transcriptional regulator
MTKMSGYYYMVNPLIALVTASVIILLGILILWPGRKLLGKLRLAGRQNQRILIEDALKHIYDCERHHTTCPMEKIAGLLSITTDAVTSLLSKLETMRLLQFSEDTFKLTAEGRSYALRIIRTHRLWERYLADETDIPEESWHREAERIEHKLSDEEINALSKHLGNPRYDPHGDPIPTIAGDLPPVKGDLITGRKAGDVVRIVHIEDEPAIIYSQIIAENLHPGHLVEIVEKNNDRIILITQGREISLSPLIARNISVIPVPEQKVPHKPNPTLLSLQVGEAAEVVRLSRSCRGQQRRRLMDLGVVPGSVIRVEMPSATGDPIAYNIRGALIALRKEHARMIYIKERKQNEIHAET